MQVGLGHGHVMHAAESPRSVFSLGPAADAVPADGPDSPVAMVAQLVRNLVMYNLTQLAISLSICNLSLLTPSCSEAI